MHRELEERWRVDEIGNGKVSLKSHHGLLLRGHPGGDGAKVDQCPFNGSWDGHPWEQWKVFPAANGRFAVMSCHGLLLRAWPGTGKGGIDQNVCKGDWNEQTWEQWEFVRLS